MLDEANMIHIKDVIGVLSGATVEKIMCFYDIYQIGFVDMDHTAGIRESMAVTRCIPQKKIVLNTIRRFGKTIFAGIRCLTSENYIVENKEDGEFILLQFNTDLQQRLSEVIQNMRPQVILAFDRFHKATFQSWFPENVVETVHSFQGNERDRVLVIAHAN